MLKFSQVMEQSVEMLNISATVYRKYINQMKRKPRKNEGWSDT